MDILNTEIEKYIGEEEQLIFNESLADGYFLWLKISLICWGLIFFLFYAIHPMLGVFTQILLIVSYLKQKSIKYVITNNRLLIIKGLLNKQIIDIPLNKITDIQVFQGFISKLFYKSGELKINTAGTATHEALLRYVRNPFDVKKMLSKN